MENKFKVVGLCGSLRNISYTRFSVQIVLESARKEGADVELIDLRDYNLTFSQDSRVAENDDVKKFRNLMSSADAMIWGTPEYHGSFSGVIKNAIDLLGRKDIENKIIGLVGIAGGRMGATNSLNGLRLIARHLHAWTIPQHVSVPSAESQFDPDGKCLNMEIKNRLEELGQMVVKYGKLHKMNI